MPDLSAAKAEAIPPVDAGFEYFTTTVHYQSIAGRILAALAGGGRFVLVTGTPAASGPLLANALSRAAAGTHTVIEVPCGKGLTREDWRRLVPGPSGEIEVQEFSAAALLVALGTPLPLYVLADVDQLSDEQLREFFATWLFGEPTIGMAVLVITPAFLARLERPALSFLIEGLAARILFQHLGPDEIGAFIRQQLGASEAKNLAPDTVAAIAVASGGDPALVTRLALRARDPHKAPTAAAPLTSVMRPAPVAATKVPEPGTSNAPPAVASETAIAASLAPPPLAASEPAESSERAGRLSTVQRRLLIGGTFVVAYIGILLVLGTLIPRHFRLADEPSMAASAPTTSKPSTRQAASPKAADRFAESTQAPVSASPSGSSELSEPSPPAPSVSEASAPHQLESAPVAPAAAPETVTTAQPKATGPENAPPPSAPTSLIPAVPQAAMAPAAPAAADNAATNAAATTAAAPPAAAPPAAASEAASPVAPTSTASSLSADDIAALIARGDAVLATGDIVSARLYYERAATGGSGHAALLLAETYDPALLKSAGLNSVQGDAARAAVWYSRARALGDRDAERRLQTLGTRN